jgi:hypothetical protein
MKKADHPSQTGTWLLIDKRQIFLSGALQLAVDIVSFEAEVMKSTASPGQKLAHAAFRSQRLQQLDLALSYFQQGRSHALFLNCLRLGQLEAEDITPESVCLFQIRNDHSDMMDSL